ncbi:MAG: nucleoside 2-deoxyribosyltransferase [Pseudomonadota bacterium]
MTQPLNVYFAGALFSHKDLIGNALVASAIHRLSDQRYRCLVPQDMEQASSRAMDIRDQDLRAVIESDLAIFNFDGTDLDSGTVVEFVTAKNLDLPSVLVRTDFRLAGDQDKDGEPWNLMCSFFPRTEVTCLNGMQWYHEAADPNGDELARAARLSERLAARLIECMDTALAQEPVAPFDRESLLTRYHWALTNPGGGLAKLADDREWVEALVDRKLAAGIYGAQ